MSAATPAAAPPAVAGGSRAVSETASTAPETVAPAEGALSPGPGAAEGSTAAETAATAAPPRPEAAAAAGGGAFHASQSPLLQQPPAFLSRQGETGGSASGGEWPQPQISWPPQQQQQPYLPAAGGVCCVAPWATETTRTGPLYLPPRGAADRGDDPAAAASASASTAAAAALYPDEAALLCCEKKIRTVRDLSFWISSSSYSHYVGFLRRLSLAVVEKRAWRTVPPLAENARAGVPAGAGGARTASAAATQPPLCAGQASSSSQHITSPSSSSNNGVSSSSNSSGASRSSSVGASSSSSSSDSTSGGALQTRTPLGVIEEGAHADSSSCRRESRNKSSRTATETSSTAASAEPEGSRQRPRRLSTEDLLTPTAGAAGSEEMIEAALVAGSAEAKQRAAALAAAATQDGLHVSEAVVQLLELLQHLLLWVEDIKPVEQPMRFGNKAFRNWLQRLECSGVVLHGGVSGILRCAAQCCQRLLTPLIPALPRPPPAPLLCDTIEEDPEREAAEAASASPPPGVATNSGPVADASFRSASPSSDSLPAVGGGQEERAAAAAEALEKKAADGDWGSSSSRSSSSSGDTRAVVGHTSAAGAGGVGEATAAASQGAAALPSDQVHMRLRGNNTRSASGIRSGSPTPAGGRDPPGKSSSSSSAAEEKVTEEMRSVDKRKVSGKQEEEEEHVRESFVRSELLQELIDYLCHSFGDARRLDYGTGHEASFALFLLVLYEAHILREGVDDAAAVLLVFTQYVEVCHALQRRYSLEPAGSRGAWGLDDFHFLPFLFGSAQLQEQHFISPSQVMEPAVVHEMAVHNLYFSSIEYIMQTKRGAPFSECAPMLYDISGISSWKKIHAGLLRMYEGEVLNKFPIAQHFLFGRYFPLNLLDASGSA